MDIITHFPGYQIIQQLYAGTRTLVYRGIRTSDQQPVVIKLLRNEYPNFNDLVQFRNQYTIAKNLDFPSIIKPLTLEVYGNGYALVMEDFGGFSLSDYLQTATDENPQSQYLPLGKFLKISLKLTEILHYLYQNRVIHKDIKPANILIDPATKQIKLIDFSIASLLPRETQEIQNTNDLEGTLAYLSPEQTGRMNRGIDYRSDFYSLGMTFYKLLTGTLPFKSEDAMELVHCHLAKQPIAIHQIHSEIPLVLSEIVSKLIAKNAENRYQSALGIKHDLEICLAQLQTTGTIEPFEIGKRDISDRFLITERLYGREAEVNQLLNSFDCVANGTTEMLLVAGFSGIGKTAVVNEVHKPIVRQRGYFIKGKYDQFQRNIPFSAFVEAFRDLMGQLLSESEEQLQTWKTNILAAVGENGQVLINVIPELENIIGKQPPSLELSGTAAQNRFNLLFQKFVKVFTSKEHPLVMFLDDWQWADSASLNLLSLLRQQDTGYLLILGAYRDNEVSPVHPFILTVDELLKTGATVNTITLPPLRESDINRLVADTLNCELSLAQPLTELVYQKTKGNPFFATQFLKGLHDDKLITFNWDIQHWQCDIAQINTLAITDDVVEFMALQLQKLPIPTQDALKLAACIGAQFDLHTLTIVSQESETETATVLWRALQEGLILPISNVYKFYQVERNNNFSLEDENANQQNARYRFLHDRVQQAAYSLIPRDQKQATHLKIGQLLQQNLSEIEKEENLFALVGHLNLGIGLITQAEEREALARLNLAAGQKARNSTAYSAARSFVQIGIDLLTPDCWQNQYELTLNLYVAAAETAYLNADFDGMEEMADIVLRSAKTILDKVKIFEIQINALTTQSQMLEAIAVGTNALAQLGIELPCETNEALTRIALQNLASQIEGKQIEELANLPVMSDPRTLAAMQLLGILFPAIFMGNRALQPLLCATMVSLSLQFGNAPASTIGYVGYGIVLSGFFGEVEQGYRFGRVALSLLNQLNWLEFKCITLFWFGGFIQHRQEALRGTIPTAKQGYLVGMETGDFLNAGYSVSSYLDNNFLSGVEIDAWEAEIENYRVALETIKQYSPLVYVRMIQQTVQNLREIVNQPDLLIGTAYNETVMFPKHNQDSEFTALALGCNYKLMLAYLFGNYANALYYIAQAKAYLMVTAAMIHTPVFHFYAGLTYLAVFSTQSEIEQANTLALLETHQKIIAQWAHHAPMNHQHKVNLVEAEKCRVLGKNYEAGDLYDRAIAGAKENQYIQEEALANELAAKFYLDWGKEKVASGYMQEAYYCYTRWGAKAKVAYLEQHYPQLLGAILQPTKRAIISGGTISPTLMRSVTSTSNSNSQNLWLDFPAVMKAAQAISQEIELEKLLATLMQIAIAHAGAQTGILVIDQDAKWLVVAKADQNHTEKRHIPLAECQELPQRFIYSVARSQTTAVFDNLSASTQFAGDRYIITQQPKSALCIPISNQGKLIAILYLENNLTVGAFTSDRIETLQILSAQAAISIENARLYQQVENYSQTLEAEVERKTEELSQKAFDLEQTLKNLQQTQAQLIQSEKMSAVGQLVAGIAHEINNPVTFIHSNLEPTENHIKALLNLLELYHQEYPNKSSAIKARIEEIELAFITEDLTKILQSMKVGSERIKQIILSLRNFSRLDEADMKSVDLHAGLESTLLILQNRFQESDNQPKIEVIKEYGNLPDVTCYASEMNQVFMSIITNAIDALKQVSKTNKNPLIRIQTEVIEKEQVRIAIADNGSGIAAHIQERIFEPFFTTKPVGNGTGLGLSVSYAIIKKHGGQLICNSTVGSETKFVIKIPIKYP
ncbi:trifunctional serine/threonine-protein kinase/ATP-binding protein/sensor histidine kinase [Argonema galeatum]|uniref:trifunctional serine/threonine-protein kinase/ATP-binding protein/sensor histidine kinase n=1 Tax=Argonema galeatum TaxID=2942762 RepID=UPI0020139928|nr:ATP-binding sensor histidine kinase [Argonema galeatum]MCL1464103.1 AAA family ATPase [Argonema galeatum A003/A1]